MNTPLERTNFFFGQMLSVADLEREQRYLIGRQRRHCRFAHGWGVLHGLEVRLDGNDVLVSPGMAIDCEGNQVELMALQRVGIAGTAPALFVGIKYVETLASPTPGPGGTAFATIVESAEVEIAALNACAGHAGQGPRTPGCGQRHAIVLARLRQHGGRWQLRRARCGA
jgi:hypothetical protein